MFSSTRNSGRDCEPAECTLLFCYPDRFIQEFLVELNNPEEILLRELYELLRVESGKTLDGRVRLTQAQMAGRLLVPDAEKYIGGAVRVLERHGCIERDYSRRDVGRLLIPGDLKLLARLHQTEETQRSRLVNRAVRHYGQRLKSGVACSVDELCGISGLRPDQVSRVLHALHGELLDWTPPHRNPAIRLSKLDMVELNLDFDALRTKREFDLSRLDDMLKYVNTRECRQRHITAYFGQDVKDWRCESCDRCRRTAALLHREADPNEADVARLVLHVIMELQGRYGRGRVSGMLAGLRKPEILEADFHRHPAFCVLAELGHNQVLRFFDDLEKVGLIAKTDSEYPCIDITRTGLAVLDGRGRLQFGFPPGLVSPSLAESARACLEEMRHPSPKKRRGRKGRKGGRKRGSGRAFDPDDLPPPRYLATNREFWRRRAGPTP